MNQTWKAIIACGAGLVLGAVAIAYFGAGDQSRADLVEPAARSQRYAGGGPGLDAYLDGQPLRLLCCYCHHQQPERGTSGFMAMDGMEVLWDIEVWTERQWAARERTSGDVRK